VEKVPLWLEGWREAPGCGIRTDSGGAVKIITITPSVPLRCTSTPSFIKKGTVTPGCVTKVPLWLEGWREAPGCGIRTDSGGAVIITITPSVPLRCTSTPSFIKKGTVTPGCVTGTKKETEERDEKDIICYICGNVICERVGGVQFGLC